MRDTFYDIYNNVDHFIMVSNFINSTHLDFRDTLKGKTSVLWNFTQEVKAVSKPSNKEYFLYVGRLSHEKGLDTLVQTFNDVNANLMIVGTGPEEERLRNNCAGSDNIKILGFKSGNELAQLYAEAHFLIIPSEWNENNPMTVIEAFSYGTPVIGSSIGGIPELVREGQTGYLFTPGCQQSLRQKIQLAKSMKNFEYENMSNFSREFYRQKLSKNAHYNSLINIYKKV